MSKKNLSRREFLKIATVAAGTAVVAGVVASASMPNAVNKAISSIFGSPAKPTQAVPGPSKMDWWYEARFGMFIHFGSYAYLGMGEWAMYNLNYTKEKYQTQVSAPFNPTNFNATVIAKLARNAGMKYLVITAKHHEGFAMWDSAVSGFKDFSGTKLYNLRRYTNSEFPRDILMELKDACVEVGIKFGLYYSILDWSHYSGERIPKWPYPQMTSMAARNAYIDDMKAQLAELISRYDPAILWFDGCWSDNPPPATADLNNWFTPADGQALYDYLIGLKPELIINNRVFDASVISTMGDFITPEQSLPSKVQPRYWETCATMNGSWGYNYSLEKANRKPPTVIQELVSVVSRDGNYLLNHGPKEDGSVVPGTATLLNTIGIWMVTYGDSIYATTGTPFADSSGHFNEPDWGRYTKKSGKLFAHVFTWPTDGELTISGITNPISKIYSMSSPGTPLSWSVSESNIVISVPASAPNKNDSVICIECTGVPTPGTPSGPAT